MSFMSPLPDGSMDKLNDAILEFTSLFAQFMLLGYFEVAIEMAKEKAAETVEDDPEQLLELPVPDWTIKSGWMTKEGGNYHSWKKRFFVARNEADKFVIEYYSSDKCLDKEKKGWINCSGYRAAKDNSKKPNGITLTPWDDERRAWHMACETPAEQDEWISVFENATWHAKPSGDPDEMVQRAFEIAFNKLKTARGFWYSFRFDRSPAEMLAKLLVMDLDREVVREILAGVSTPGSIGLSSAKAAARKMLVASCTTAAAGAWSGSKPALDLAKTVVEEKVIPGIQPIIDAQVALQEQIVGVITAVISPVTNTLRDTVFTPLMAMVLGPMSEAFKAAIKGFSTQVGSKKAELKEEKVYQGMISDVSYSYWHASPMVEAYQIIRNLDETALGKFCEAIPGVSAWSFIYKLDSMLRDLLRRAIYTMHKFCADMDPDAALAKTLLLLVHDGKQRFQAVVSQGMKYMVGDFFDENLVQPCVELVKPVSEAIPEAFKTILSVEGLLEESLNSLLKNVIKGCTSEGAASSSNSIDSWEA
mmetsp:Transcript_37038/g.62990  ORF Transcript_37038/g.62990 Transcript_37038/m.62990 type:complete len:532 (-) Transcript_37038:117-1712(-)